MNEFLKMNIFFVIASIAAIILTILAVILLVYLIKFIKNVKYISDKARTEADNLSFDIQDLRKNVRSHGFKLKYLLNFLRSIIKKRKKDK